MGGSGYGCHMGPNAIRKQLIPRLKKERIPYKDFGNIEVPNTCIIHNTHAKCLPEIKKVHANFKKFLSKNDLFKKNRLPVLLGGDHSFNYSFIKASAKKNKIGLIWFDAHGDFNTPAISPSGNIHGMILAALAGRGLSHSLGHKNPIIKEENICIFGVRDLDALEKSLLAKTKVTVISAQEMRKKGIEKALAKAIKTVSKKTQKIHLSFDLDFFDPIIAPGTGTPVKGGLKKTELSLFLSTLRALTKKNKTAPAPEIASIDIMELNPTKDKRQKTAKLAAKIITYLS